MKDTSDVMLPKAGENLATNNHKYLLTREVSEGLKEDWAVIRKQILNLILIYHKFAFSFVHSLTFCGLRNCDTQCDKKCLDNVKI